MKKQKIRLKQRAIQRSLIIATAAFTCVALPANDHEGKSDKKQAYGQEHHGDKSAKFIQEALQGGQMEVKMAQLGQQKAQNAEVKRLAERLVQDHQQANQELQQLAQGKNIQPADHEKHKGHMDKLEKAATTEFDKEFVKHTIKHHKKGISKFEQCSKDVQDAQLKAFIDKTLPKLREHLQMAQAAARTLGISDAELTALEAEDASAAGAPAAGVTETEKGDEIDQADENQADQKPADDQQSPDQGASATLESSSSTSDDQSSSSTSSESSAEGAAAEIESSTDSSSDDQKSSTTPDQSSTSLDSDAAAAASIDTSNSGFDAATRTDSSLTINQNTPAAIDSAAGASASRDEGSGFEAQGQIGDQSAAIRADADLDINKDDQSSIESDAAVTADADVDADIDVDTDDADASVRTDLDTDKDDGKILGVERKEGDGKVLGIETKPGDGKTLGLNTDKSDGKLLGVIPWRDGDKDVEADVDVDTDADVDVDADSARADADIEIETDSVGGPGATVTGGASSGGERIQFNQLPEQVKTVVRAQGADNNATIKRMTVYEVEVNGKKMYVHEDGTTHQADASQAPATR